MRPLSGPSHLAGQISYSVHMSPPTRIEAVTRGTPGMLRRGRLFRQGAKYGFQSTMNAKNLRQYGVLPSEGEASMFQWGTIVP